MATSNATAPSLLGGYAAMTPESEACTAATGFSFALDAVATPEQLRRMCAQDDCGIVANSVLSNRLYYGTVVEDLVPAMERFVSPLLDFCYHYHVPGQACASDFVWQLLKDLAPLTTACETKSGVSLAKIRPPSVTFSFEETNATVLRPLCGVAECANLMKRLDLKEESTICPLAPSDQDALHNYVAAYARTCDVWNSPSWVLSTGSRSNQARAQYVALPGPLPSTVAVESPVTPLSLTPVPTTTRPVTENSVPTATPASKTPSSQTMATSALTTQKPTTTTATSRRVPVTTSGSQSHSGSGSGHGVTKPIVRPRPLVRLPSTSTPMPSSAEEPPVPVANTQASTSSTNTLLWGTFVCAIGLLAAAIAFILWRRHRRKALSDATKADDNYHALDTSADAASVSSSTTLDSVLATCRTIPLNELSDLRIVGGGGNGVVYLVRYTGDDSAQFNGVLASKRVHKNATHDHVRALVAEIQLAATLSHPRIVTFVGIAGRHKTALQALFEYVPGGDLKRYIDMLPPPTRESHAWTPEKLQIAIDIADALGYLHTFELTPVVHRDLKSRNVMLTSDKRAKLGDFGVSRPESAVGSMTTGVGTSRWVAPEVILGGGDYTTACDIYSFGVVLSELDTHRLPFSDLRHANGEQLADFAVLPMVAMEKKQPSFSDTCPTSLLEVARKCLSFEPASRPTAVEVAAALRLIQREMGWQASDVE